MQIRLVVVIMVLMVSACGGSSGNSAGTPGPVTPLPQSGLDARPANLSCLAPQRASAGAQVSLEPAFADLNFITPLALLQAPGDDSRWFVVERDGRVRVFDNVPGVDTFNTDFIAVSVNTSGEGGLLGMAFAPDYSASGDVYLSLTEGSPMQSVVARFSSSDGGLTLDPGSREDIVRINQDFSNHNGGQIAFGNDGFLYVGIGDGGSGGDPNQRAQDTSNLLGAMLRLDVSGGGAGYAIPADNPFAGNAQCAADHSSSTSCPEIYAWGLRNPWRWSFDSATGDLWAGDVGQNTFEEIDIIERGGNYGWDCREGFAAFTADPAPSCSASSGFEEPVFAYDRSQGDVSVTGGYVYRGTQVPALAGAYVFGDFSSGRIWQLVADGQGAYTREELFDHSGNIFSYAQGNDGELYVLSTEIYRIVAAVGMPPATPPVATMLSDTGCFDPTDPQLPAAGLVPYDVNAPFWSDGADKERWLALPDGTTIDVDAAGDFQFPPGAVLAKHFRLGSELIETRLLMRHPDGVWAGYTWQWNAGGTDAQLVVGGQTVPVNGQDWVYPSGGQCMSCHTSAAGVSLGLELAQLNADFTYAATGRTHNQIETLDAIGMFTTPVGDASVLPALADPFDANATLDARARSYLHVNCAQCHRPGGPTPVDLDLRATTLPENTQACAIAPSAGDLGITDPLIIAPGEPARSVLLARMNRRDADAMPPLASTLVDDEGVALIDAWIAGLDAACR